MPDPQSNPALLVARLQAQICHAKKGSGQSCRESYGLESWCSACLAHAAADQLIHQGTPLRHLQEEIEALPSASHYRFEHQTDKFIALSDVLAILRTKEAIMPHRGGKASPPLRRDR